VDYLHLPDRVLPPPPDRPNWYETDLARWRAASEPAVTWGNYVDLKGCLQYAYLTRESREDIPFWLERLTPLLESHVPRRLQHAARHQTIVATHLGLGSIHAVDHLLAGEIEMALESSDASLISDAVVVVLLACGALARDETSHTADQIMTWNRALTAHVSNLVAAEPYAGQKCLLLESLAALRMQPDLDRAAAEGLSYHADDATADYTMDERLEALAGDELTPLDVAAIDVSGALDAFARLAETLPQAPLYPVEHASRFLTLHTLLFADEPRFDELVDVFDQQLAACMGSDTVADKALDRASTFFSAGRVLEGLRHLHRARLSLFNGEAGSRLIHATLATAQAYHQLNLFMAAKYFGLVAAYLAQRNDSDLFAEGLFKGAAADYYQGNWVSSAQLGHAALHAHGLLAEQPFDPERHPWVPGAMFELTNIRALSGKLGTPFTEFVDSTIAGAGIAGLLGGFLEGATRGSPPWWADMDAESVAAHAAKQLGCPPFGDAATRRRARFTCLGVDWTIEFANTQPDVVVGERLGVTMQILLAHLAPADPCIMPTRVTVVVTAASHGSEPVIEESGSTPAETRFQCRLATIGEQSPDAYSTGAHETLAAAAKIVVTVSARSDSDWETLLEKAFEQKLASIATFVVPHDVALQAAAGEHQLHLERDSHPPIGHDGDLLPEAGPGLGFPEHPGPGYTLSSSRDEVQYKYDTLPALMIPTLTQLRSAPEFAATVSGLRKRGWLDWHILTAVHGVAKNARLNHRTKLFPRRPRGDTRPIPQPRTRTRPCARQIRFHTST
jgi:hypothetical protein